MNKFVTQVLGAVVTYFMVLVQLKWSNFFMNPPLKQRMAYEGNSFVEPIIFHHSFAYENKNYYSLPFVHPSLSWPNRRRNRHFYNFNESFLITIRGREGVTVQKNTAKTFFKLSYNHWNMRCSTGSCDSNCSEQHKPYAFT